MMQKTPFVQKEFLFKNDEKSHINRWVFSIKKHSRYDIMKHVLSCIQESNYLEPSAQELDFLKQEKASFASQVHFEKLPQNIEDILMGVKEKFPSWHVSVACDPYFFSITSPLGKDFWKYAQERADYWRGKYAEADAMVLEFLTNSEKWKQALIDQGISFAGTISSQQMYEDIRDGKWADDKDPIFYTPVKHTYHHTKYDMVVVWTQYGKSPKEADAIAYLQALTAADFEGFMNM
ncbi:MAG: hypothetical protein LRY46_03270 [Candidatus Pacebacteria bacterium]|nr:hypothetical protein [Candidatus Paceibacterota bacterium]